MPAHARNSQDPFSPLSPLPVIATAFSPTIDASTLSEVIVLTNPTPIHGSSLPAFQHDHAPFTHSLIMSGIMHHSLATLATRHALYTTSDTTRHTLAGKESLLWHRVDGGSTLPGTA